MRVGVSLLIGLSWSAVYILLESAQSVFFGTVLQTMDSFFLGFWVFGITTLFLTIGIVLFDRQQINVCRSNLVALFACNCSTAVGWIFYLFSIQLIEPAVAFTVSSAAMPIAALGLAYLGFGEPEVLDTDCKRVGFGLIVAGTLLLVSATLLGLSGFVRGTYVVGSVGLVCAILSGGAFALMLVHCKILDAAGLKPVSVFAFRFLIYVLLSSIGWLLNLDYKSPVELGDAAGAIFIGLMIMAFPLFAMQKAISSIGVFLLSTITALGPFIVFCMQVVEGRVAFSGFTLAGLLIYSFGAFLIIPSLVEKHEDFDFSR